MQQTVYLNGKWLPIEESCISTQDRGFLFGDGVYEVIPVFSKQLFAFNEHLARLKNSLAGTSIHNPLTDNEWLEILETLIAKHPWENQFIYLQVTRGIQMQRDHMPSEDLTPTVYAYTNPLKPVADHIVQNGIKVITLEDIRWLHCDLKAITLLPNVMMKLAAKQNQADDAILVGKDGMINEGTASNLFIVKDGILKTPPNSRRILPGITRLVIERIAEKQQFPIQETPLTQQELENADEIWLTSSTKDALPVTQLNDNAVGTGRPGKIWQVFRQYFEDYKQQVIQEYSGTHH